MADEFASSVDMGLQLTKRIYYGKNPPKPLVMEKKSSEINNLPTAPMVYAVVRDPSMVDNPDIPSYQPYVHGRCDPPALIPLDMQGIAMEVDCYMDTAFVTVNGTWRVHCIASSRYCDCRIAVPMGEQGSVLGVEIETPSRSYSTLLIESNDTKDAGLVANAKDGFLLNRRIYTLKVPQVAGGSILSVKVSWSQKILYQDGQFSFSIPFSFPWYVNPIAKLLCKKERIRLNVNSGMGKEIICGSCSHPLKETRRLVGTLGFLYESEVRAWSMDDFSFSYKVRPLPVHSSEILGSVLLNSVSMLDVDQREMFCFNLYPPAVNTMKVFRKEVVYVVDISASMQGRPLENIKSALLAALSKLSPADTFNIIAFNGKSLLFSSSLMLSGKESIGKATQWIDQNFVAEGSTDISLPLNQAIEMLSKNGDSIPLVFLITDGSVGDEREICEALRGRLMKSGLNSPRISTFGIGLYCNHYFLQMLAQIGRGYYDAAYDLDSISSRLERLLNGTSSVILADLKIEALESLDSFELYPCYLPDLLSSRPLIVSGRFIGTCPGSVKVSGTLADLSSFVVNVKVQKAKDLPLERVFAKRQIETITGNAWFSGSKQLEEMVAKLSLQTGVPSEYTNLILVENLKEKQTSKLETVDEKASDQLNVKKIIYLRALGVGFGNLKATADNLPVEAAEPKLHETSEMFCSRVSDQCAVTLAQICTALACFECISFCCEKLLVLLRDGRKLLGILRSFDQFANAVLESACERAIVGDLYCDIPLGLYIIRGENVVLIGELDVDKEELPPHMTRVSEAEIRRAQKAERDSTDLKGSMRKRMEFLDMD
uniref:VWFA domain-containing protein n=1 Tax=Solanum lycopersicum TaxID=4081 RepID=A0A3Q7FW48_SOLLC